MGRLSSSGQSGAVGLVSSRLAREPTTLVQGTLDMLVLKTRALAAVLRREMMAVLTGFVAGATGIAALGHTLTRFVFEVPPTDVPTIAGASAAFLLAAAAGSDPPIRRALRVEPRALL